MLLCPAAQYLSQFVAGLTIAYVKNWRIALVLSVILPCIMIAGGVMGASESRFKTKVKPSRWTPVGFAEADVDVVALLQMLAFVAEGGTLAEEVISSIRTSRAFGTEHKLVELYQIPNAKALYNGRRLAFWIAVGLTSEFTRLIKARLMHNADLRTYASAYRQSCESGSLICYDKERHGLSAFFISPGSSASTAATLLLSGGHRFSSFGDKPYRAMSSQSYLRS
jgi:ABC-type multidrug transport system fused ATPase/permease subunit